jgi:uncharacterized iron-regulated protein
MKTRTLLPILALLAAGPASAQVPDHPPLDSAYTAGAYRVYTGAGEPAALEDVLDAMGRHQVVFIGETHDDPTGHMLEAELLRRAHETHGDPVYTPHPRPVTLSLEFFERDVQPVLDEYLEGLISESSFLADSRPSPRYASDYRSLVEYSKEHRLEVIAANAPRRYVSRVSQRGRESLEALGPEARALLPPLPYGQPSAAYRDEWIATIAEVMEGEATKCGVPVEQPPAHAGAHADMGNLLHSQVLWDAAMAYRIAEHLDTDPDALVLHVVGGFHVARGTGTPEHLQGYRPGTTAMVVMLRPVADVDAFEPAAAGTWGDFVIQTEEARTLEAIECGGRADGAERRPDP